jgi:hypothetical protein
MNKMLWTVHSDQGPVAEIAAASLDDAWAIVAALDEFGDLPRNRTRTEIRTCPDRVAARTRRQAKALGLGDQFLARVQNGMFLTAIGGHLSANPPHALAEHVA